MDAVLVIDIQQALVAGAYQIEAVIEACNRVIAKVRGGGGLVVFIQHQHHSYTAMKKDSPGWQLDPRLDLQAQDYTVHKQASDAFYQTTLQALLQQHRVDRLFISGMQTEYCVDASSRSALSLDYEVVLVSDAHTTGDSHLSAAAVIDHHNRVLANLAHPRRSIAVVASDQLSFKEG